MFGSPRYTGYDGRNLGGQMTLEPNSPIPVASVANLKAEIQRRKGAHPDLPGHSVSGMAMGVSTMSVGGTAEEKFGIAIRAGIFDFLCTQNYDFQLDSDAALGVLATMPLKVGSDFDGEEFVRLVKAAQASGS
jgi:hypothetical protein